jgi:two-component system, OmpR family, manganese sensing sensor histidine kinase
VGNAHPTKYVYEYALSMFQITRRRLAFWYTSITAILLLLFATGVYLYVRNTLIERVDDTLNHVVEVVERSLTIKTTQDPQFPYAVDVKASFRNNSKTVEDDHIDLEWFDPQGKLLWSTFTEPLAIPLNPSRHETITVNLQNILPNYLLRQVTSRVKIEDQFLGYLRVSHPWFEVTKPSRDFIIDLGFGTILMIISVAGIGWFLSGLAMQPVRDSYQSLKQFTSDASHELRNPIAIIQTNVQLALADPDLDPKLPEQQRLITSLQVVERLSKRLGKLVDDLLFLARSDSGIVQIEKQIVHIDSLLIQVVEEQQLIADQQQIELSLDFQESAQEEDFALLGDRDQIARLITNLVSNAINYTPSLGRVEIVLSRITKSRENWRAIQQNLTQNLMQNSPQNLTKPNPSIVPLLQVTIKDTGIGIPPLELERIFDRFYRVDTARSHQGNSSSGLGLAIAQTIIQNHQGEITVTSIPDQGTTFSIIFPSIVRKS